MRSNFQISKDKPWILFQQRPQTPDRQDSILYSWPVTMFDGRNSIRRTPRPDQGCFPHRDYSQSVSDSVHPFFVHASSAMLLLLFFFVSSTFIQGSVLLSIKRPLLDQLSASIQDRRSTGLQATDHYALSRRSTEWDQIIATYTEQGLCFHYFAKRPSWHPRPCMKYCENNGGHGYSGVGVFSRMWTLYHPLTHPAVQHYILQRH